MVTSEQYKVSEGTFAKSSAMICCWFSRAQLFLVSVSVVTNAYIFASLNSTYLF
jgi:hypothetical protein